MSDDLRKAFQGMRMDLAGVKERLHGAESAISGAAHRFDTFLVRFDEVADMLITHDTEQLQRVTSVEQQNDELLQKYEQILRRLDALENKNS